MGRPCSSPTTAPRGASEMMLLSTSAVPAPVRAAQPVQNDKSRDGVLHVHPQVPRLAAAPPSELALAAEAIGISAEEPTPAPEVAAPQRVVELTLELDGIQARYPLLRNVF